MISIIRTQVSLVLLIFDIEYLLDKIQKEHDYTIRMSLEQALSEKQATLKYLLVENCYIKDKEYDD